MADFTGEKVTVLFVFLREKEGEERIKIDEFDGSGIEEKSVDLEERKKERFDELGEGFIQSYFFNFFKF